MKIFINKKCAVESEKIEVYGDFLRSRHHWWMYKQVSLDEKVSFTK